MSNSKKGDTETIIATFIVLLIIALVITAKIIHITRQADYYKRSGCNITWGDVFWGVKPIDRNFIQEKSNVKQ